VVSPHNANNVDLQTPHPEENTVPDKTVTQENTQASLESYFTQEETKEQKEKQSQSPLAGKPSSENSSAQSPNFHTNRG
jgi:hypothetical protein